MASGSPPTLYLFPGLDGGGAFFTPLVSALAGKINVEVLTYPTTGPQSYDALSEVLLPRLTEPKAIFLGESFGGPLAIKLARRIKIPPRALILAATFCTAPLPLPGFIAAPIVKALLKAKPVPVLEAALLQPGDHQLAWDVFQALSKLNPSVLSDRLKAVLSCDVRADLAALDLPILYIRGRHDKLVSPAHGLVMHKIARNLTIATVNTPHFVLQYDTESTLCDIILPFLADPR